MNKEEIIVLLVAGVLLCVGVFLIAVAMRAAELYL